MSDLTQDTPQSLRFSSTGLLPSLAVLSRFLRLIFVNLKWSPTTPETLRPLVWAIPISLATTMGISFDLYSTVTKMFQFTV